MRLRRPELLVVIVLTLAALAAPLAQRIVEAATDPDADPLDAVASATVTPVSWLGLPLSLALAALVLAAAGAGLVLLGSPRRQALVLAPGLLGAALPVVLLRAGLQIGVGAWLLVGAVLLLLWQVMVLLSRAEGLPRRVNRRAGFGDRVAWRM